MSWSPCGQASAARAPHRAAGAGRRTWTRLRPARTRVLDVHTHHLGDTDVVAPVGELDLATAHSLGAALAAAADRGAQRVMLDLRRLTFVDSSGIGVIVKFQR